jgi:hypothetical protein
MEILHALREAILLVPLKLPSQSEHIPRTHLTAHYNYYTTSQLIFSLDARFYEPPPPPRPIPHIDLILCMKVNNCIFAWWEAI